MIRDVHFCCTRQKPFVKNDDSIYLLKYTVPPLIWPGRNEEKLRKMKNKFRVYTERSNLFLTTCIMQPKTLCSLAATTGVWIPADRIGDPPAAKNEHAQALKAQLAPQKFAEGDERWAVVPVMPAVVAPIKDGPCVVEKGAPIKAASSVKCYRSGARSCVVPVSKSQKADDWIIAEVDGVKYTPDFETGEKLFRLKGCGMWLTDNQIPFPGITFQKAVSELALEGQDVVEIRGVCFVNTSVTELRTLKKLQPLFTQLGARLGNVPVGFWMYKDVENDPAPLIQKTVTIMETFGDKRFETHLLAGFEKIIPQLYAENVCKVAVEAVGKLFKDNGMEPPSNTNRTYARESKVPKNKLVTEIVKVQHSLSDANVIGMSDQDVRNAGFLPSSDIIKVLPDELVAIAKLYANLGWEAGRILAGIHRSGFVWGTYVDHCLQELHCNAHTDNLIILPPDSAKNPDGTYNVFAGVDFDMSFTAEQAVNFWEDPPRPDPEINTLHFATELGSFLADIGGLTATVNGVTSAFRAREQPPGVYDDLLWILRDISVYEALASYLRPSHSRPYDLPIDDAYRLIFAALEATADENS